MVLTEFDENKYAELIREEGREEGFEEGRLQGLCELVSEGDLSLKTALKKAGMTEKEFEEAMARFGLKYSKK